MGFDEALYRNYLRHLIGVGLGNYPDIVDGYLAYQKTIPDSILPPTPFLYIFCAYLWHGMFGTEPLACFHAVSRVFSIGTLLAAGGFARRLLPDKRHALAVFALMAFSPLQIHLAQHALVDGFFEFWALLTLWALWENLRQPGRRGWLAVYTGGLALMVTTKENAFFVFVAIPAILVANRWLRFGTVSRPLLVLTFIGPVIGVAILTNVAGGLGTLIDVYRLGVPKNLHLEYAIVTGDGPLVSLPAGSVDDQPVSLPAGNCDGFPVAGPRRGPSVLVLPDVRGGKLFAHGQCEIRDEFTLCDHLGFPLEGVGSRATIAARGACRRTLAVAGAGNGRCRAVRVRREPILPVGRAVPAVRTGAGGPSARAEYPQMNKQKGRSIAAPPLRCLLYAAITLQARDAFPNRRRAAKPRLTRPAPTAAKLEGSGTAEATGPYSVVLKFSTSRL